MAKKSAEESPAAPAPAGQDAPEFDTGSWLVEELLPSEGEGVPPADADEDWGLGEMPTRAQEEAEPEPDEEPVDGIEARFDEFRVELEAAERRLGARLVDEVRAHALALEKKQVSLTRTQRGLSARLDRLESRFDRLERDSGEVQETLGAMARHRSVVPDEDVPEGGIDLNQASFEDLRRLGFSSTQAARVVTYREANRGFDSLERLREVPGLPGKLVDRVRQRARVQAE